MKHFDSSAAHVVFFLSGFAKKPNAVVTKSSTVKQTEHYFSFKSTKMSGVSIENFPSTIPLSPPSV